jgi:5-methylcytosine-specific restriction endonuclease McrA
MVARTAGRKGRPWERARLQCITEEYLCVRCGEPVDKSLPGTHKRGPSADHYPVPLGVIIAMGGDPNDRAGLRLAHQGCNSGHGNRAPDYRRVPVRVSREW